MDETLNVAHVLMGEDLLNEQSMGERGSVWQLLSLGLVIVKADSWSSREMEGTELPLLICVY